MSLGIDKHKPPDGQERTGVIQGLQKGLQEHDGNLIDMGFMPGIGASGSGAWDMKNVGEELC